jgi:hypothetical protein
MMLEDHYKNVTRMLRGCLHIPCSIACSIPDALLVVIVVVVVVVIVSSVSVPTHGFRICLRESQTLRKVTRVYKSRWVMVS